VCDLSWTLNIRVDILLWTAGRAHSESFWKTFSKVDILQANYLFCFSKCAILVMRVFLFFSMCYLVCVLPGFFKPHVSRAVTVFPPVLISAHFMHLTSVWMPDQCNHVTCMWDTMKSEAEEVDFERDDLPQVRRRRGLVLRCRITLPTA